MLAHGFDPVQTQRVQHGTGTFHDTQNRHGQEEPEVEADDDHDDTGGWALDAERTAECHGPENDGELLVSKWQGPKTEVGCSVRDTIETEF